ncbi:hypothetical protein P5673_008684 [Acropora cervicornis]|uniref:Uncharacterized protein n=1 Tax=Acropora cervicornis TaxID=6130 RepID=A0AAD9QSY0_ACRCE|nr:hypothetical protein P5673_008684 [Acropora cervicornis]
MKWTLYRANWIRSSFRVLSPKSLFHRYLVSGTDNISNPVTHPLCYCWAAIHQAGIKGTSEGIILAKTLSCDVQ